MQNRKRSYNWWPHDASIGESDFVIAFEHLRKQLDLCRSCHYWTQLLHHPRQDSRHLHLDRVEARAALLLFEKGPKSSPCRTGQRTSRTSLSRLEENFRFNAMTLNISIVFCAQIKHWPALGKSLEYISPRSHVICIVISVLKHLHFQQHIYSKGLI